jgi:choline dehydrogenase-like flavoprotein
VATLTVVGSGASAVHFALSALESGHRVVMIDVGREGPASERPDDNFLELKAELADPAAYFLGTRYEAVVYPDLEGEYYGFPPNRSYVFEPLRSFEVSSRGFDPLFSFARGGLAEVWTGGCYPFNAAELAAFPFGYQELAPFYDLVAKRIGISGVRDDLADFIPIHDHLMEPLRLDHHSSLLLERYGQVRSRLQTQLGAHLGRARVAVLSADRAERKECRYLGRCLWGCPIEALYTPSQTLSECQSNTRFEYLGAHCATHFKTDGSRRIRSLVVEPVAGGEARELSVETLVLAAGTLSSSRIVLESIYRERGDRIALEGLMDNRQILVPFLNLRLIGRRFEPESYQYNQLAIGLEGDRLEHYVHCLVTTLKTALLHPVVQGVPLDLRTSLFLFRNLHAALGLINVNFHDTRRSGNSVSLEPAADGSRPRLQIRYSPAEDEAGRISGALRRLRRVLWHLGCVVPPGMVHVRPMGASVHYAGTFPMSASPRPSTVSADCRSHDFDNLYLVDGSSFPFLPAKNITFTLMANAARVATQAF